ncbi:heavy-metal-associated domain-containing protein [Thiomicrorhabdus sp. 6S2-11]|jgi:copper chaperone|uniref:Heavy-metal-associated domain-containing protein n=1 Tax=Thiomicrorhabdus marina TaxID=2818442 RepID=A0ABS3Q4T2_9GAMM|nr:heavy-metal-associated domain-containing protein [Thiomicrorhabdus marina]MBO1927098.1 heavy-metal-associated domain-containing protein [Thiomicrorhabdus marina]
MEYQLQVDNIKCGGCAGSISKKLNQIEQLSDVQVDIEQGMVAFQSDDDSGQILIEVKAALLKMGYPETGSVEGARAMGAKAKSFVSCAVGKMSDSE